MICVVDYIIGCPCNFLLCVVMWMEIFKSCLDGICLLLIQFFVSIFFSVLICLQFCPKFNILKIFFDTVVVVIMGFAIAKYY